MRIIFACFGMIHGVIAVALLALLQAVIGAFADGFELPFSIWWGMMLAIPGIAASLFFGDPK